MVIKFSDYSACLKTHFSFEEKLITEDLIRYWFIDVHRKEYNFSIEEPYYSKKGYKTPIKYSGAKISDRARADLYVCDDKTTDAVFEFKYHRKSERSSSCRTTNVGEVFNDLNRLSLLDNKEKYLVYVFDKEMASYYEKRGKEFDILKPTIFCKGGASCRIDKDYDGLGKGFGEFKKRALSSFEKITLFMDFNYVAKEVFYDEIKITSINPEKTYYLVIYKVE